MQRRRHPDVDDRDVRRGRRRRRTAPSTSPTAADDLETRLGEDAGQASRSRTAVLGDDDAHGSSTAMVVPAPAGCHRSVPPSGGDPVLEAAQPGARRRVRPAARRRRRSRRRSWPSRRPSAAPSTRVAPRVLGHVGQRLGDDEVGGRLDGRRQPPVERVSTSTGTGERSASDSSAATETSLGEDRRVQSLASSRSSPIAACASALAASSSARVRRIGVRPSRRRAAPAVRSETRRCCAPSWRSRSIRRRSVVLRLDDAGPRCADLLELGADLGLEPLVLDRRGGPPRRPPTRGPGRRAGPGRRRSRASARRRSRWSGRRARGRRSAAPACCPVASRK